MRLREAYSRSSPVLFVAALVLTFPAFDSMYTEGVSFIRVVAGKIAMSTGIAGGDGGIMLGIFKPEAPYSLRPMQELEQRIGGRFDVISFYTTWGDRETDAFPMDLMKEIDGHGAIAMLTWEPWTTEFGINSGRADVAVKTDLQEIAGGRYDSYVREWAREAVVFGKPLFLRFAHEMNNPQYPWSVQAGNTPGAFIAAWHRVWNIFSEEGAENVIWVWSPKREAPRELYPGGAYVDWIGTGVFNYGPHVDEWHTFEYLYESIYRSVVIYDKPVMIAEIGCSDIGGSRPDWCREAWRKLQSQYPETRAVILYNNPVDRTLPGVEMNWAIDEDDVTLETLSDAVRNGVFKSGKTKTEQVAP